MEIYRVCLLDVPIFSCGNYSWATQLDNMGSEQWAHTGPMPSRPFVLSRADFSLTLQHLPGSIHLPYHVNRSHDNSSNSLPSHLGLYFSKKINSQFKDLQKNVPPLLYLNEIIY